MTTRHRSASFPLLLAATALVPLPRPAAANHDCTSWNRPYLADFELRVRGEHGRDQELSKRVEMSVGESIDIVARGFDQRDERFPADRFAVGVELDRGCEAISIGSRHDDGFRITAGKRRGECEVTVWVPGNLNLERTYRVEVGGREGGDWTRGEAEDIAKRLYRAILAREPDGEGLRDTTARIQQGRLEDRVAEMLRSGEFRDRRTTPQGFLEGYYRGLLGRDPDSGGVRVYLDQLSHGGHAKVILAIVKSEEFEGQVRKN